MPTATLPSVSSSIWSGSISAPAAVIEGVEAIKQHVFIVLHTPQGSDSLRPFFGSNIYQYIDQPVTIAAPKIKTEIIDALSTWVPEIVLGNVSYIINNGVITFTIASTINGVSQTDILKIGSGIFNFNGLAASVICDAQIPPYYGALMPSFTVGNKPASPSPPEEGFSTLAAMMTWIKTNWISYGTWGLGKDVVVCYLKLSFKYAKLKISKFTPAAP